MSIKTDLTKTQTGPQISSATSTTTGVLSRSSSTSYATYRSMRADSTIAMARALSAAPIQSGSWSVEADDDVRPEYVDEIRDQFLPMRSLIYQQALTYANVDYGWTGMEKVFGLVDGRIRLIKLKPLLNDITTILVDAVTGAFAGLRNMNRVTGMDVDLPAEKSLLLYFRGEAGNLYGTPLMANAVSPYNEWTDANIGAARYDKKIAGSHWAIYFPPGTSRYNGDELGNDAIAKNLINDLEASASIAVPGPVQQTVTELGGSEAGWKIEILEDSIARQTTFIDRLKYLDVLKIRSLMLPERAVTEGEHGTKAEASAHQDLAFTYMQELDKDITRMVNWHVVNQVLVMNWGPEYENKIRLVATPLIDETLEIVRQVYLALLANPLGFAEEGAKIDTAAMKDKLGIPAASEQVARLVEPLNQPGQDKNQVGAMRIASE